MKRYFHEFFRALSRKRITCFVIHFNRPSFLLRQLEILSTHPRLNIYVVDNHSNGQCLQQAQAIADRFDVQFISMQRNYGHTVVWDKKLSAQYAKTEPYIVTDCDVIPNKESNYVEILEQGLAEYPQANKIGLELNISRIPLTYPRREEVIEHERNRLYRKVLNLSFQECAVDTTFALYRTGYHAYSVWGTDCNEFDGRCLSLRTLEPKYEADHLGWHVVPPYSLETLQYFESIKSSNSGHWRA